MEKNIPTTNPEAPRLALHQQAPHHDATPAHNPKKLYINPGTIPAEGRSCETSVGVVIHLERGSELLTGKDQQGRVTHRRGRPQIVATIFQMVPSVQGAKAVTFVAYTPQQVFAVFQGMEVSVGDSVNITAAANTVGLPC